MKTQIPRFLLGSPKGWKTFDASADCVILPGFSSYDAAANYCQTDTPGIWELQGLGCDQLSERLKVTFPQALKLVAIDPMHADELSLAAITLDTVCHALRKGENLIDADYRLMRDHWDQPLESCEDCRRGTAHPGSGDRGMLLACTLRTSCLPAVSPSGSGWIGSMADIS